MCVKTCPFEAIQITGMPSNLNQNVTHKYGANTFRLHRLPVPKAGKLLGLVGGNGIGKSTALNILGGNLMINLGNYEKPPDWREILKEFRGSELQDYFKNLKD